MDWLDPALDWIRAQWASPKSRGLILGVGGLAAIFLVVRAFLRWKWLGRLFGLEKALRRREIRAGAEKASRQGNHVEAARRYESLGEFDRAAELALKGGNPSLAGEMHERAGRKSEAAAQYLKAGLWDKAAAIFEKLQQHDQAADCYRKAHKPLLAAEMFQKAGRREDAAKCYLENGQVRKAADLWHQAGSKAKAADAYAQCSIEFSGRKVVGEKDIAEIKEVSSRAAELYQALNDPKKAYPLWDRAGEYAKAGEAAMAAGDPKVAAGYFKRAGQPDRMAEALQAAGDAKGATLAKAESLMAAGEKVRAAELLESAGETQKAAAAWIEAGEPLRAAGAYSAGGYHRDAGLILQQLGDHAGAALAFEKDGAHALAEQAFRKLGDPGALLGHFQRRGDFIAAGKHLIEHGDFEAAAQSFRQVAPTDSRYAEAVGLAAHAYNRLGRTAEAIERFQEASATLQITSANARFFYEYAGLLEQAGRLEEALAVYDQIGRVQSRYADIDTRVWNVKAALQEQKGEVQLEETHFTMDVKPPDRYAIREEVSRGSEGVVYLAQDTKLKRDVAVKCLAPDLLAIPEARARFLEEGQALAVLDHPNIVRIYDVVEETGSVYLVTEFVKGVTLKQWIAVNGKMQAAEAAYVGVQVASGLAYAHARKVVHRDIKPANIALPEGGGVKILDFGLAKVLDLSEDATRRSGGTICGTPRYMSPEQVLGRVPDFRTDLYSLGATLFELVAGRAPFEGGDLLYQHIYTPAPSVLEFAPDVPAGMADVIARCLAKAPEERYPSAEALALALQPFTEGGA